MQEQATSFFARNWLWLLFIYVAYSSAVDAMEVPGPTSSQFYRWLYRFAHGFAGNLVTAFGKIGRTPWPGETTGDALPTKDRKE